MSIPRIIISGGGIGGLTAAIALKEVGIEAVVYEAAPTIKPVGAGLALAANAIKAFHKIGIRDAVISEGRLLEALVINDEKGVAITRTDTLASTKKYGADNFAIHRANLHRVLMSFLDENHVITGRRVVNAEQKDNKVFITFSDGTSDSGDYLIAADGIHSPVRKKLLPASSIRYAGYTCWRAVIDYPTTSLHEASETWGPQGRFGIVPLKGNQLYWFACVKASQNDEQMKRFEVEDLIKLFAGYHSPIPDILAQTKNDQLIWNDILDLAPLPAYAFDRILLIGDAAHATTPNMGQGACQAIEDGVILASVINESSSPGEAFKVFEQKRLQRTQYIVRQSRLIGTIAQLQNPVAGKLRNALMRLIPSSVQQNQLDKILSIEF